MPKGKSGGAAYSHQKSGSYGDRQVGPTKMKTPIAGAGKATGMKKKKK